MNWNKPVHVGNFDNIIYEPVTEADDERHSICEAIMYHITCHDQSSSLNTLLMMS